MTEIKFTVQSAPDIDGKREIVEVSSTDGGPYVADPTVKVGNLTFLISDLTLVVNTIRAFYQMNS